MRIFASGWSFDKDGPGQRLMFYLKGCNMRCCWCANPESLAFEQELLFYPKRSSEDFDYVCDKGAVRGDGLERKICRDCRERGCVNVWHHKSFEIAGTGISPEKILKMAITSRDMFGARGGVTFGGGEPTLQAEDLFKTLRLLRTNKINTAVESNASTETFTRVARLVDYLICDLKAVSDKSHIRMTGISNRLILDNLNKIALTKKALLIRIPIISGLNDGSTEMGEIVNFLADLHRRRCAALKLPLQVELLRMHHLGKTKYDGLGIPYPMSKTKLPDKAVVIEYMRQLSDAGIEIVTS